jgi:hypothetical protein
MSSRSLRYLIPLPLLLMALLNGWFAFRTLAANVEAIRHYTRMHAMVYVMDDEAGRLDVKLMPPGADYSEAETVRLYPDTQVFLFSSSDLTVYVNPEDHAQARLGGFRMWLFPILFLLECIPLLIAAYFLATLEDSFGWKYCTPAPWLEEAGFLDLDRRPGSLSARFKRSSLRAALIWGAVGLGVGLLFASDVTFVKRVTYIDCGLAWFFAFALYAYHGSTYRLWADEEGMKAGSTLVWKAVPWRQIKRIENRLGSLFTPSDWLAQLNNLQTRVKYVRFADEYDETLLRMPENLAGPLQEILAFSRTKTSMHPAATD